MFLLYKFFNTKFSESHFLSLKLNLKFLQSKSSPISPYRTVTRPARSQERKRLAKTRTTLNVAHQQASKPASRTRRQIESVGTREGKKDDQTLLNRRRIGDYRRQQNFDDDNIVIRRRICVLVTYHTTYIVLLIHTSGCWLTSSCYVPLLTYDDDDDNGKKKLRSCKVLVLCKNKLPDPVVQYLLYTERARVV